MCVTVNAHSPEHCGTLSLSMTDITHGRTSRWLLWIPYGNVAWPISRAVYLWNCCRREIPCIVTLRALWFPIDISLRKDENIRVTQKPKWLTSWTAQVIFNNLPWNLHLFVSYVRTILLKRWSIHSSDGVVRFTKSGIDQFELREVRTTIILQTNQVINSDYNDL